MKVEIFAKKDIYANLVQKDISQVFIFAIIQRKLHRVLKPISVSLPLSPNNHNRHTFQHKEFIRNGMEVRFFQLVSQDHITLLNRLALEIFSMIYVSITC